MDEQHTRHWIQQVHLPLRWCCDLCPEETWFDNEAGIESHILVDHKDYADQSRLSTLKELCEIRVARPPWVCPVCNCIPRLLQPVANSHRSLEEDDVSREKLLLHVATHLKTIGFLSITLLPGDDEDEKTQASGASRGEKANASSLPPVIGFDGQWIPEDPDSARNLDANYISQDEHPPFLREPWPLEIEVDWNRVIATAISPSPDQIFEDTVELVRGLKGPEHPDILTSLTNLAKCQEHQGDHMVAMATYREAVELSSNMSDGGHEQTIFLLETFSNFLRQQGRIDEVGGIIALKVKAQALLNEAYGRPERARSQKASSAFGQRPPPLAELIRQALVKSEFDQEIREFIPEGSLDSLITKESILWTFCRKRQTPPQVMSKFRKIVDIILTRGKKLFAISLLTGFKNKRLRQVMDLFESNNISDSRLPLENSDLKSLSSLPFNPADDDEDDDDDSMDDHEPLWTMFHIHHFCGEQWKLCAPIFSAKEVNHHLHEQDILPFIEKYQAPASSSRSSFGQIMKCKIHPSHLDVDDLVSFNNTGNALLTPEDD